MPSDRTPQTPAPPSAAPTTPKQRIDAVTHYWLDVMGNYYRDMAATTTPAEARAVEDNYNAAERLYLDAIECGLKGALHEAARALAEARARVDAISVILASLTLCTEAATSLVRSAA
jgi:hypothetical protein